MPVMVIELKRPIFEGLLTMSLLVRACATQKPVNFID